LTQLSRVHGERYYLEAQLQKSRILADQGQLDVALTHLAEIVPRSLAEQVQIYLIHEELLRDAGQIEKALKLLNAALTDIPDDPDLLYARGLVTAQLKRIDEHERDMRRLIELQPDNAHAYNALGYTLADQAVRLNEALVLIEQAIELRPRDPFILDSLGWVRYRLGDYELAVKYLKEAMELRPDPEIAAHLGEVLWRQGNLDEARDIWQLGRDAEGGETNLVLMETILRLDP
jgi:Flp pilus assembly protein TadD